MKSVDTAFFRKKERHGIREEIRWRNCGGGVYWGIEAKKGVQKCECCAGGSEAWIHCFVWVGFRLSELAVASVGASGGCTEFLRVDRGIEGT